MGILNSPNKNNQEEQIFTYTNGDKYVGAAIKGVREGFGTYYYYNGDKYEGMWKNNKKHGTGSLYYKDGNLFIGMWNLSEKEGIGALYSKNGEKYYGEFKAGKKSGKGFLYSNNDKTKYRGYFLDNKKHGPGVIEYLERNKSAIETWDNGVLIKHEIKKLENNELKFDLQINNNLSSPEEIFIQTNNTLLNCKQSNASIKNLDNSFEEFVNEQVKLNSEKENNSKASSLEVAKYFKARIPNNYFDATYYLLKGIDLIFDKPNINNWTLDDVEEWIHRIELGEYKIILRQFNVQGLDLLKLNIYDITQKLKIKNLLHVKILLKSIDFLRIFLKLKLDYYDISRNSENVKEDNNLNTSNEQTENNKIMIVSTESYNNNNNDVNLREDLNTVSNDIFTKKESEVNNNLIKRQDTLDRSVCPFDKEYLITKISLS